MYLWVNILIPDITKLQNNLLLIRNVGGWTAEVFGDMIGVTKQTISNLENKKTEMTKTQYIAIRAVLDYEMEENPNREMLKAAVNLAFYTLMKYLKRIRKKDTGICIRCAEDWS